MAVTIADLIEDDAELEIHCLKCGKLSIHRGRTLLEKFGRSTRARILQGRLRCQSCRMTGELRVTFPDERHKHERLVYGVDLHERIPNRTARAAPQGADPETGPPDQQ